MQTKDFVWVWQGIQKKGLSADEVTLLHPIEIKKSARKKALLLLHGFSSTPAVFRELLPALRESSYDGIFIPALPGHAKNINEFSNTNSKEWIDYLCGYAKRLTTEYEEVDVMGLSLGGLLAYHLGTQLPIHHLYLLAPAFYLHLPFGALILSKLIQRLGVKSIRNRGGDIHCHRYAELTYRRLPLNAIVTILDLIQHYKFTPPRCPTDVFLGKYDTVVNSTKVEKLFLNQPDTTIHWLTRSAHVLPLDSDKHTILKIIQNNLMKEVKQSRIK